MDWHAFCKTCNKELDDPAPNGGYIEIVGRIHKKENPNHIVFVGYLVDLTKGKE